MQGKYCKQLGIILLFVTIVLSASLMFSCRRTLAVRKPDKMPESIIVSSVKTTPETPGELCGEGDLKKLFDMLKCYNGNNISESVSNPYDIQDKEFKYTNKKGYKILKFDVKCRSQITEMYITLDACDLLTEYEEYNTSEHRLTEEDYDDKSMTYETIDSYEEIAEPYEVLEPEDSKDTDNDKQEENSQ